jgi:hypothetical protein
MFAHKVIMMRPKNFGFNQETGKSNYFQNNVSIENINEKAQTEFDAFVNTLQANKIEVVVFNDTDLPVKPDAIFLNNWFSVHAHLGYIVYSMQSLNRRAEKNNEVLSFLEKECRYKKILDLTEFETSNEFLEGTGSLVFDHENKICYACISIRTSINLANKVCEILNYRLISFTAKDKNGNLIYHTNVMMCAANNFVIVCLDSVVEKELLVSAIQSTKKEIIEISLPEMEKFAGNMLFLKNANDDDFIIMSNSAFTFLNSNTIDKIKQHATILPIAIPTIETIGGGSVRCMLAELF